MLKIAAITTVYDEREFLPIWRSHYGRMIGLENLIIIDDGSTDGSTQGLEPSHVIRRPKAPIDQIVRAVMVAQLTASLLEHYDVVIYVDVDELLVVDPLMKLDFAAYLERVPGAHLNAFGFNVLHRPGHEPDYDPGMPVLENRQWLEFEFGYCKQLVHRSAVKYSAGFHRTNKPLNFAPGLYLFHLRAFDARIALRRIEHRRLLQWSERSLRRGHGVQNRKPAEAYMAEVNPYRPDDYLAAPKAAMFNDFVLTRLKWIEGLPGWRDVAKSGLTRALVERPDRFRPAIAPVTAPIDSMSHASPRLAHEHVEHLYETALAAAIQFAEDNDAKQPGGQLDPTA